MSSRSVNVMPLIEKGGKIFVEEFPSGTLPFYSLNSTTLGKINVNGQSITLYRTPHRKNKMNKTQRQYCVGVAAKFKNLFDIIRVEWPTFMSLEETNIFTNRLMKLY